MRTNNMTENRCARSDLPMIRGSEITDGDRRGIAVQRKKLTVPCIPGGLAYPEFQVRWHFADNISTDAPFDARTPRSMSRSLYLPSCRAAYSGGRTQTLGNRTPDSVYNMAGMAMQYIDIKYPRRRADFRRVADGFALVTKARRMGATDVVHFIH